MPAVGVLPRVPRTALHAARLAPGHHHRLRAILLRACFLPLNTPSINLGPLVHAPVLLQAHRELSTCQHIAGKLGMHVQPVRPSLISSPRLALPRPCVGHSSVALPQNAGELDRSAHRRRRAQCFECTNPCCRMDIWDSHEGAPWSRKSTAAKVVRCHETEAGRALEVCRIA